MLTGDFASYKNCIVGVSTLKNCDVVSHIAVIFPEKETWSALRGDYEGMVRLSYYDKTNSEKVRSSAMDDL